MNILTKICIIVSVPVILFASAVFLKEATTTPNLLQELRNEQAKSKAAESARAQAASEKGDLLSRLAAAEDAATRANNAAAKADNERLAVITPLREENSRLVLQMQDVKSRIEIQIASIGNFQKLIEAQRVELADLRKDNTALASDKAALTDKYRELQALAARTEGQLQLAQEQVRNRDDMILDLKQQMANIEQVGGQSGGAAVGGQAVAVPVVLQSAGAQVTMTPVAAGQAQIVGKVETVKGDLASVNVGKVQGVQPGMKLVISSGSQFVGYLLIEVVEPGQSAGVIVDKQHPVQVSDVVSFPGPSAK